MHRRGRCARGAACRRAAQVPGTQSQWHGGAWVALSSSLGVCFDCTCCVDVAGQEAGAGVRRGMRWCW